MDKIQITSTDNLEVDWNREPNFQFTTETDALEVLQQLGEDLKAVREQERQIMRYLKAAAIAARRPLDDGKPVSKEAIINHSGVARQTIYNMIGEK